MNYDVKELLAAVDPARLTYQEWVNVGMVLKDSGALCADWDDWSRRDAARWHKGDCLQKWRSFGGRTQSPVTLGTLVQYARDQGWRPAYQEDIAYEWDDVISHDDDRVIVDQRWLESKDVPEAPQDASWNPVQELTTYLETLFEPNENVGYVVDAWEKEGRWMPSRGNYDRTAGELIQALAACGGDMGSVLGDYKPEAGAWIRFNPLDGNGVKNDNVTEFRYALVESDAMEIDQQFALLHELELPIALVVHSGGKSLHAIVKIGASNYDEYRKRVDYLYSICEKNGLKIDTQNRNPSRLSRMPGVLRRGQKQYIVAQSMGKNDWDEWKEWTESVNDDLPAPESMAEAWDNLPPLSPPLIDGVLRMGHKMLLAGPSKAGKSFALIELCIAIAEGNRWFGWQCTQGRVMYVNLELDRASCLHRFKDVYEALGWQARSLGNIDIWNLRGKAIPMDKLAPKLIRRAMKKGYTAIVIDPIYKVITGDENSADQMANFCNQFDKVCTELGCAVIYCHHHSKGGQGQKRSMDRASGSGVFARDPDAMLDMIELDVTDALRKTESDRAVCAVYERAFDTLIGDSWYDTISQDDRLSAVQMKEHAAGLLTREQEAAWAGRISEAKRCAERRTAWRIEGTLREFEPFKPLNLWFDYPVHKQDASGALGDLSAEGEAPGNWKERGRKKAVQGRKDKQSQNWETLQNAFDAQSVDGAVSVSDLMAYSGFTRNTVKSWVDHQADYERDEKGIVRKLEPETEWK